MFEFFRKYQRYFFLMTTIVIVISFSFFGTFGALSDGSFREQIAFRTVNGVDVTRHELDEMVGFLATDADDKKALGGIWGPNFLNDGVIKKNFLESGLVAMLAKAYSAEIHQDLMARLEKEKHFTLYEHPQARGIGIESAWNYFLPGMTEQYYLLRSTQDPLSPEALQARITLYLMERQMPPTLLKQVLRYQEKQYTGIRPDANLDRIDLSLFGYHTIEDWFGPRFLRIVAQFVINAAAVAQDRGYYVSKADAAADLMRNSELSFQQNTGHARGGVKNSSEYFNEQLRRLGMDRNMAIKTWQQVLLFRRLFQDMGSSVFVDTETFTKFNTYASTSVEGELYQLPKGVRISSFNALQKLQSYIDTVSNQSESDKQKLIPPTKFLSVAEVAKKNPALVQKRYLLNIAHFDKTALEGNIGLKETWAWETDDAGWDLLKKEFPQLVAHPATTREARYAALDALDDKTRAQVDARARSSMINMHPEWIEDALSSASVQRQVVGLREKNVISPILGLTNGKSLMELLDAASLYNQSPDNQSAAAKEANAKLRQFTADDKNYYRIVVVDRAKEPEILSFVEADQQGALDKQVNKTLESFYAKIREANPKDFQRVDKTWKSFSEVKNDLAQRYFENILKSIRRAYAAAIAPQAVPEEMINDYAATLYFLPYMTHVEQQLAKSPEDRTVWIKTPVEAIKDSEALPADMKLADQWKLESVSRTISRSDADQHLDKSVLFAIENDGWTKVNTPANGNINFFHVKHKIEENDAKSIINTVGQTRNMLSNTAQQHLMNQLLVLINSKKAISLDYLIQVVE